MFWVLFWRRRIYGFCIRVTDNSETRNWPPGKGKFNKSRSKSTQRNKIWWISLKECHFKKQCYKWLERNKGKVQIQHKSESSMVRDDAHDLVRLIASVDNMSVEQNDKEEWVVDTGCSFHMTSRRDVFIQFQKRRSGKVKMENNNHTENKGIVSVSSEIQMVRLLFYTR